VAKVRSAEPCGSEDQACRGLRASISRLSDLDERRFVPLLDAGVDEARGLLFVIEPFLTGCGLEVLVEKSGPLHPIAAVRLVLQACEGLRDAHAKNLIHGDVNPSNLFLEHLPGGEVVVRISEFGLEKWASQQRSLAATGSAPLGPTVPPLYLSPEQLFDEGEVDARADVWGIGLTLYYTLCSAPSRRQYAPGIPGEGPGSEIPDLQNLAPWIPPGLSEAVHTALIHDRDARCPTIAAWMDLLAPYAGGSRAMCVSNLTPVPPELARVVEERGQRPERWDETTRPPQESQLPSLDFDPLSGSTIGGYRLARMIGRGGMGSVYEATNEAGKRVALKVLQEGASSRPDSLRRLVREAKTMTKIASPYVVRILDAGEVAQRPYLVMDLLHGTDLARYLLRSGALDPEPVVRLFIQVCEGLHAAHGTGVIHRDIKLSNIFIHELANGTLEPKLFDFGVAKRVTASTHRSGWTKTSRIMGSPRYMSPEQAQGAWKLDRRSDIWSLGVSLFEAIAGINPWHEYTTIGELLLAICTRPPPLLIESAPWVEPGLATVVHRCLSRNPDERYQTAEELAAALAPYAARSAVRKEMLGAVSADVVAGSSSERPLRKTAAATSQTPSRRHLWVALSAAAVSLAFVTVILVARGCERDSVVPAAHTAAVPAASPSSSATMKAPPPASSQPTPGTVK